MLSKILNLQILLSPVVLRNGPLLPIKGGCTPLLKDDVETSALQESMPLPQDPPSLFLWTTRLIGTVKL